MRNIIVFESIVELVAVDRPEVAGNLREDIALLEGGTLPTSSMLALAPSLDRWLSLVGVGVIQLHIGGGQPFGLVQAMQPVGGILGGHGSAPGVPAQGQRGTTASAAARS